MKTHSIIILAAAAILSAALTACNGKLKPEENTNPIGFSTETTKAVVDMPAGTFTAAGKYCSGSSWTLGASSDVFSTAFQNISTDGAGSCTYTPVQYWKANSVYRFRAISPIAPDQVNYTDNLDGSATITNFTVSPSAASQKDLLLSDMATATISSPIGNPAPVALTFRHLLCKIRVQIIEDTSEPLSAPGSDVFTITGVKLTGLPDSGTYTGTSESGSWNTDAALLLSCVNNTAHTAPDSYSDPSADIWSDGLKLIPMTITNQVNLVLDYTVTHSGETSSKSVVIPIPSITWEAGKQYTYQLALSEDLYIYFGNISVDSWGATQASGTVIIK